MTKWRNFIEFFSRRLTLENDFESNYANLLLNISAISGSNAVFRKHDLKTNYLEKSDSKNLSLQRSFTFQHN